MTHNNPALLSDPLYAKSQVYICRGFRAKKAGDSEEYQLWASLALELLGKSTLSGKHPALIADPNHIDSLFAACGINLSPERKTISARTLFERLSRISKKFDKRIQGYCIQLAVRRNSEIHSGESPFSGIELDAWEKQYWHAVQLILELQNKELSDWIGTEDAKTPKQLLEELENAIASAVQNRIIHARDDFEKKHRNPVKRQQIVDASSGIGAWQYSSCFDVLADGYHRTECPACGSTGILGGVLWHEEILDEIDPDHPSVECVEKIFSVEEFLCPNCDLQLKGTRETAAAGLPEDFSESEERERQFEPDYGND